MAETEFNDNFFDQLGRSPGVVAGVNAAAEEIAQTARRNAPVDSGEYRNGIVVQTKRQRRHVALVVGTDPKTMIIESQLGILARAGRAHAKGRGRA